MPLHTRLSFAVLAGTLSTTALFLSGAACVAQNSGFNLELHADSKTTAKDLGLPAYPGATIYKDKDNDAGADLGFTVGDVHFRLKAVNYVTSDSPTQILAFYRKPLSRFGEVLECDHGKPVGALTVTQSGLTCADKDDGNMQVNGSPNSSVDHELRVGTPSQFRIVAIDGPHSGTSSTRFGMVYLELPKDKDDKKEKD
jgi:hypothetical protein